MNCVNGEINSSPRWSVAVDVDPMSLREAFEKSLAEATWLTEADEATIALAHSYIDYLERAEYEGEFDVFHKAMSVAGPNLQRTFSSLGLNPDARGNITAGAQSKESKVDELKKRRLQKEAAG